MGVIAKEHVWEWKYLLVQESKQRTGLCEMDISTALFHTKDLRLKNKCIKRQLSSASTHTHTHTHTQLNTTPPRSAAETVVATG